MLYRAVAKRVDTFLTQQCARQNASQPGEEMRYSRFVNVNALRLALGANIRGRWGEPRESLLRACRELEAAGIRIVRRSDWYITKAVGGGRQPCYVNAVVTACAGIAPGSLLRLVKRIERRAGRRAAPRMSARPLDIDHSRLRGPPTWTTGYP